MYYNLKIKSKDSEYSLESKDKDVIRREMDLYFANLLNVSKDFLDGIKKVVVKSKDVKSIHLVENPDNFIISYPEDNSTTIKKIDDFQANKEDTVDSLLFKNDKVEEVVVEMETSEKPEISQNAVKFSNISNKFNTSDFVNFENKTNSFDSTFKNIKPTGSGKSIFSFQLENKLMERQNNIEKLVSMAQSGIDDVSFGSDNDLVSFDKFSRSIDNSPNLIDNIDNSLTNFEPDFRVFLTKYRTKTVTDEFLACAFYIKNVLRLDNFTMKFINSRLFQATGRIADMTTVQQLVSRGFLKLYVLNDLKSYSITSDGEKYFATQFKF